jgi:hypothetical protein
LINVNDQSLKERILKQARFPLKMIGLLVGLLLLVGTVALAGCQTADSDPPEVVANVEPVLLETATAVSPTQEPVTDPTAEPVPIDNCLDCHTNKELLIQTADPEEEVIKENESAG